MTEQAIPALLLTGTALACAWCWLRDWRVGCKQQAPRRGGLLTAAGFALVAAVLGVILGLQESEPPGLNGVVAIVVQLPILLIGLAVAAIADAHVQRSLLARSVWLLLGGALFAVGSCFGTL